jgi:DNA-binding NarL/FixJ family response regulator
MTIRVAIADDSLIVREGIEQLLRADAELRLVASCGDLAEVERAIARERPDVVVADIRMPPTMSDEGIRLAVRLRAARSPVGVIVLSQYDDVAYVLELLDRGSDGRGYLLKSSVHDRAQLSAAIRSVAAGGSVVDPLLVARLVDAQDRVDHSPLAALTPRERDVVAQIARGRSNAAIAETLVLSKRAVEKYINTIFLKLGLAHDRDVSKRVAVALLFLAQVEPTSGSLSAR